MNIFERSGHVAHVLVLQPNGNVAFRLLASFQVGLIPDSYCLLTTQPIVSLDTWISNQGTIRNNKTAKKLPLKLFPACIIRRSSALCVSRTCTLSLTSVRNRSQELICHLVQIVTLFSGYSFKHMVRALHGMKGYWHTHLLQSLVE